ncbi:MAG: energy-coupling factor ABC transporter ATP-binding protein [Hyphomicrobiales bacterium]|nr:energy-coupling factor ABC transporter ATP-binding protein [Hyphomicrobiales bacterium]
MLSARDLASPVLGPVSLDVAAGECVAVMGASGAGKSLLLRAIADLDPNDGDVALNGIARNAIPANAWRQQVALVPAESGWWADIVGEHFIAVPPDMDLLEALGLAAESLTWTVARLSSGEKHRLAILRALSLRPKALLLDEPSASLDEHSTERLEAVLQRQRASGVPIVLVTHDAAQAERLATRIITMAGGRIAGQRDAAT